MDGVFDHDDSKNKPEEIPLKDLSKQPEDNN